MRIIDERGKLWFFGLRINIIDFIVFIVLPLYAVPMFYFGWRIFNSPTPVAFAKPIYLITRTCSNCGQGAVIEIRKGEPVPKYLKRMCGFCENVVVFIQPKLKPKPILPAINWSQAYNEYLLKKTDPEYYKHLLERKMP